MSRSALVLILIASFDVASAQHGFVPIDDQTTVADVGFTGNRTFPDHELNGEIVTEHPSWLDPVLFWKDEDYTFRPAELQKDVHRLQRFYRRQGFLEVSVDYLSRLDSVKNSLDIDFTIEEGEPLILQSVDFLGPDGRAAARSILESKRSDWSHARKDNTTWRIGQRPAMPEMVRVQSEMNTWLRNNGYAFSSIGLETNVDSTARVMDVVFQVDPGPVTYIGDIEVKWLDDEPLFSKKVILRQLPFVRGDLYSLEDLTRGQRGLFNLNVFQFALVDTPEQPSDSTVNVRVRVQRGDLNVLRAETGYGLEDGIELKGEYTRRNFLGGARRLTLSGILNTAIGERAGSDVSTTIRRRAAVSLFQPYLLRRSVSGLMAVFYDYVIDRAAQEEELGFSADVLYEFKPYRTLTTGISISRVRPLRPDDDENPEPFIRGLLSSNAMIGETDDRIAPTEGYLIRPAVEIGTPLLASDVSYIKGGISGTVYKRIGRIGGIAGRLFRGRLWPQGGVSDDEAIGDERFDRARYYAGGADDVRGWAPQLLGPKEAVVVEQDTLWDPIGRLDKWLANVAYRFPLPFTPPEIQWAIFTDGAQIGEDKFRIGAGAGIRYQTPVGFIRLDFAYKLNPSPEDLRDAHDVIKAGGNVEAVPPDNGKRFRVHFGIGQAF